MSEVFNEPKKRIDGVYIPYDCHAQAHVGPGVMAHAHGHAYIEILYGLEGRYTLQTNENSITFSAGDMVLILSLIHIFTIASARRSTCVSSEPIRLSVSMPCRTKESAKTHPSLIASCIPYARSFAAYAFSASICLPVCASNQVVQYLSLLHI